MKGNVHIKSRSQPRQQAQPARNTQSDLEIGPDVDWPSVFNNRASRPNKTNDFAETRPLENRPADVIETWTVLEALSPQFYKKPEELVIGKGSVAFLKQNQNEPWVSGEKSRPKHQLYYIVYLGAVKLDQATEQLLKRYQDKRMERQNIKGMAALGVVLVDRKGIPIPDTGLSISSFGWAYDVGHGV